MCYAKSDFLHLNPNAKGFIFMENPSKKGHVFGFVN